MRSLVPADPDAERWLLGALAYRPPNISVVAAGGLEPGHFYDPANGQLYAWLLQNRSEKTRVGDPRWQALIDAAPQVSRPDLYAAQILLAAARRELLVAARDAQAAILAGDEDALDQAVARLERRP